MIYKWWVTACIFVPATPNRVGKDVHLADEDSLKFKIVESVARAEVLRV